ncbi:MAG: FAD-dependent oxidoreductase [Acidobacteriaceae bacterium]|nr:FAD-dependent oxidoreductase [Acidobacteriaceae bacterium]
MGLTRRQFLTRVGQAGGYSAAVVAMQGFGLFPTYASASTPNLAAAPNSGKGVRVAILGGGIGGLVAAYELRELGYEVTLLEARSRPGGRNWTVRGGDTVEFLDGTKQHCTWDAGHYQNFGPARLPSVHKLMLGYAKKLGVELQVEVNTTRSSFLQNDNANGGKPVQQRQAINDTRGHVSELLMKSIKGGSLDQEMTKQDRERMLDFLSLYGPLDKTGKYAGSDRAGYAIAPGAGEQTGKLLEPLDMHTLLDASFWDGMLFEETFDWQATMFQPVGGMDRIPYAFAKSLGSIVKYNSPVTEIRKTAKGVRIGYESEGKAHQLEADFCICGLPLSLLKKIPNDLSKPVQNIISECTYGDAYKIAWESRRFWEQDYNVYGGLEFVNVGCSPVWFPSEGFFKERGVFVSGYTEEHTTPLVMMPLEGKLAESRKSIERLHPGHGKELEKPMYLNWAQIKWNEGSWIDTYGAGQGRNASAVTQGSGRATARVIAPNQENYEILLKADDRIFLTGDHMSHLVGWQEGAAESSHRVIRLIEDRVKQARVATQTDKIFA